MDYSLLIMVVNGMMKMATGDDLPFQQGARTGSRLVFHGYRDLRRRNFWSRVISDGFSIYRNFWRRSHVQMGLEMSTIQQGMGKGPGAPRWVVPTSVASCTPSLPYKIPNIPKTLGVNLDQKFRRRRPL